MSDPLADGPGAMSPVGNLHRTAARESRVVGDGAPVGPPMYKCGGWRIGGLGP